VGKSEAANSKLGTAPPSCGEGGKQKGMKADYLPYGGKKEKSGSYGGVGMGTFR